MDDRSGLTEIEASLALGMLRNGWAQPDIAAYFDKNPGRIPKKEIQKPFPELKPAAEESLPLKGAFSGKESLEALGEINNAIYKIKHDKLDKGCVILKEIIVRRKQIGHKKRSKRQKREPLSSIDESLILLLVKIKDKVKEKTEKSNTPYDKIAAYIGCDSGRVHETANPKKYLKKSKDKTRTEAYRKRCRKIYNDYKNLSHADLGFCPPLHKITGELIFPNGLQMDQILCKVQDYLKIVKGDEALASLKLEELDIASSHWEYKTFADKKKETPEQKAWKKQRDELLNSYIKSVDLSNIEINSEEPSKDKIPGGCYILS